MFCLQCQKPATLEKETKIRTCEDGHRTVLLTKKEEQAIIRKVKQPIQSGPVNFLIQEATRVRMDAQNESAKAVNG